MADIIKLDYDDGYRSVQLGDDPGKVIRFNPTDTAFMKRISSLGDRASEIMEKYGDIDFESIDKLRRLDELDESEPDFEDLKAAAENIDKIDKAIRELIDSAFETPVSDIAFGSNWCISPVNGSPMYINFLNAIGAYINSEIMNQNKKSELKISKYTAAVRTVPTNRKQRRMLKR